MANIEYPIQLLSILQLVELETKPDSNLVQSAIDDNKNKF